MTKEELTERRNKAFQNIEEIKVALSLDEHYIDELEEKIADIKAIRHIEKIKYTLKKIIETVHNDNIDEYGRRLVLINDFAYECLQEIEK